MCCTQLCVGFVHWFVMLHSDQCAGRGDRSFSSITLISCLLRLRGTYFLLLHPQILHVQLHVYDIYGLNGKQFYQFKFPDDCQIFMGSSGTWLVFIDNIGRKLRVWNPFSLIHIALPFDEASKNYNKVIVSCTGPLIKNGEDVVFGVLYDSNHLACIRLSDKKWVVVETDSIPRLSTVINHFVFPKEKINDLIFYKGKLYFLNNSGMVYVCEENVHAPRDYDHHYCHPMKALKLSDPIDITERQFMIKSNDAHIRRYYLVEVGGELMLVVQLSISGTCLEDDFRVFKLDFNEAKWKFVQKKDLNDWSLFLSDNFHASMAARAASETSHIYFKISTEDDSQSELQNYKVVVCDYLAFNKPRIIFSEVTKLHCHFIDPTWIIPRHT
ncbi:hypothetical protein Sjap_010912 [Stephania japonica]|uniref:KIB1-4 beta-propeller domain-containing protein n=1 Tax=Stephania japonica TaxID=461633 RepID=A0AAP0JC71_9MAGN